LPKANLTLFLLKQAIYCHAQLKTDFKSISTHFLLNSFLLSLSHTTRLHTFLSRYDPFEESGGATPYGGDLTDDYDPTASASLPGRSGVPPSPGGASSIGGASSYGGRHSSANTPLTSGGGGGGGSEYDPASSLHGLNANGSEAGFSMGGGSTIGGGGNGNEYGEYDPTDLSMNPFATSGQAPWCSIGAEVMVVQTQEVGKITGGDGVRAQVRPIETERKTAAALILTIRLPSTTIVVIAPHAFFYHGFHSMGYYRQLTIFVLPYYILISSCFTY